MGEAFIRHLKATGTVQKLTVHDSPQQNGIAECLNCTLLKCVRTMVHSSGLLYFLWGEAIKHACWIKNSTLTVALSDQTPFQAATGSKPDLSKLREWGSIIWVHNDSGSKLEPCVREGRWVGLDEQSKGVRVYWPS